LTLRQGEGSTREVVEDGFVIELDQVMSVGFHTVTDAMKEGRRLELDWELTAEGDAITAKGRDLWFKLAPDGSSHPFEAGVLLTQMGTEQTGRWLTYTDGLPG
jgi:hypothetical protein